jgi:hypothetical protein
MDLVYILLQKVHPTELSNIIQHEMSQIQAKYDIEADWHLWSQDMSHQIVTVKTKINDQDPDLVRAEMHRRLSKYCQQVTIQMS